MDQKKGRILCIDYGMARIGLAVSDELQVIAMPLIIIKTEKKTENTLKKIQEEIDQIEKSKNCKVVEIVVGLPLMMNGTMGLIADEVKHFISEFQKRTSIPIKTWDERLTSVQADRSLREGNLSRKKRTQFVDIVAAVIILQSYLDFKKY